MTNKLSDEWRTPDELFDELNQEFNFSIDLCATKENSKCYFYFKDYLVFSSADSIKEDNVHMFLKDANCAFMNPPYSSPKPFIEKAWEDSKHCKIVCLVKCDPSTRWWAIFWEYNSFICCGCSGVFVNTKECKDEQCSRCPRKSHLGIHKYSGPKPGCEVRFFPKRIKFDPPKELIDIGKVWKVGDKWVQKCKECSGDGGNHNLFYHPDDVDYCYYCSGKGYCALSGPTFSCALLIFDRRNL